MFPLWQDVVGPVIGAARPRQVVEIGALRGENTELLLAALPDDAILHVIDPLPDFDPAEHEVRFGGRYVFHRALSLDVLGELPPMDAALVDGDHNWYTVYHELGLLARTSRAAGAPLPLLVLHDVGWPYGRRDLYYDPDTIPEEFRQSWHRAGMQPGRSGLAMIGGLNPTLANADREGGDRNGVMTALDDFMAQHDRSLRMVVLPIYFGLAIVADEDRLAANPELGAALDHLESPEGVRELLELSERIRMDGLILQHDVFYDRQRSVDRANSRYLDSVKRGLIDEYYLENELRLSLLASHLERGTQPDVNRLRDPRRRDADAFRRLREFRRTGAGPPDEPTPASSYAWSPLGRVGLDRLQDTLDELRADLVRGDLADCGPHRGGAAIFLQAYRSAYDRPDRDLWVIGRFRAAADDRSTPDRRDGLLELRADLNQVRDGFERFGLIDDSVRFLQGDPSATLPDAPIEQLALIHLGADLGDDVTAVLDHLYPKLAVGGFVVADVGPPVGGRVDDAREGSVLASVERFRSEHGIREPIEQVGAAGVRWRKSAEATAPTTPAPPPPGASHAPLAPPVSTGTRDLSVVVTIYNMRRAAARTLHALSRAYQRQVDDLDYEVIVVENGSDPSERLGEDFVRSFGPEFRYIDMGEDADPSPTKALNVGIAQSVGTSLALMIDGAHVVTPGVLHYGMAGLQTYDPAVVATRQWYLGPGQQGDAMRDGYDEAHEDELLARVAWPSDGYRLFEIGHFIGDGDWFDGAWESNCLFVGRKLLEQVGGYDEGFAMAGGGYTNLEVYERLAASPDVQVAMILGEGSFHQIHGGTTTNLTSTDQRRERVYSYGDHYTQLRGRLFTSHEKPIHYVGAFSVESSRRTRSRRMTATAFAVDPAREAPDSLTAEPHPVADELRTAFIEAYWQSQAWRRSRWLGRPIDLAPADLLTYQEIVHEVGPDWIVETGTGNGGRAAYLASICDLEDRGRIVSVDRHLRDELPRHARVTYLQGEAHEPDIFAMVRDIVGPDGRVLVILGTRGRAMRMHHEFDTYAPLVPVGSYLIIEHTVLNGYPVQGSFGPGPHEALRHILSRNGDFVADLERDRHGVTFNPSGYLRRVR
jgi:cephalosporin hydroxylase